MRNLFTHFFKQLVCANQTNDTLSRDYRKGVMSWLSAGHQLVISWSSAGHQLCATPNKGTTPHTPHPIRRALCLAAMVTLLLTLACGQMWGTTYYVIPAKCNVSAGALVAGGDGSTQLFKTDGSTVTVNTDISSSLTGTAGFYYNSTSTTYANLTKTSNYGTSSSSSRTMRGIKVEASAKCTITVNTKRFSKLDVIYRCASSDAGKTLTIDGQDCTPGDANIHLKSITKDYSSNIIISNGSNKEFDIFVILTEADAVPTRYTVTYDANNGTGTMPVREYPSGTTVYAARNSVFTRSGYVFTGWNTAANGSGTGYQPGATFSLTANKTLYAQWKSASTSGTYCISEYNLNTSDAMVYFTHFSSDEYIIDAPLPDYKTSKDNYWVGKNGSWYNDNLGNSNSKSANARFENLDFNGYHGTTIGTSAQKVLGTIHIFDNSFQDNLYPHFTPKSFVLMWGKDGESWTTTRMYPSGYENEWVSDVVTLTSTQISTWKYYAGFLKSDGGGAYMWKSNTSTLGSMGTYNKVTDTWGGNVSTLSAGTNGIFRLWQDKTGENNWLCHFVPYYVLKYDANSGSDAPGNQSVSSEGNATSRTIAVSSTTPTRSGYSFTGWNTAANGSGTAYAAGAAITLAANETTLYAQWECVTPTFGTNLSTTEVKYNVGASASALTVAATAGGGSVSYQWYSNNENNTTTPTTLTGQTSTSYTPSTATAGTTYYYCVATNSTADCSTTTTSNIAKITVQKQTPTAQTVYINGSSSATICPGSTATISMTAQVGVTYKLYKDNSTPLDGTEITAATTSVSWTVPISGYTTYKVKAIENTAWNGKDMSNQVTLAYYTAASITTQPTSILDATVGVEQTLSVTAAGDGLSYQWKESATEDGTYTNVASGGTSASYSVTPASAGTKWYQVVVTGTCGTVTSNKVKIVASEACSAPAAPTISGTTSYTVGETMTLTATCASGADGSTTYTWYKGATFAGASQVQAAATGSSGYTYTKTFAADDAGTYWCEASNGTGCEAHNSVGYAVSAVTYTVTYNYNGATSGASPASVTAASVTLPTPTRTSYVLDGWYTTAGTKVGDGGDTYNPTADITLYARWETACGGGGTTFSYMGSSGYDAATSPGTTRDNFTVVISGGSHSNSDNGYWNVSSQNTTVTITSTTSNISSIAINHTDGSRSKTLSVKTGSGGVSGTPGTDKTLTYTNSSAENNVVLNYDVSGARIQTIVINSGGGGTCYHVYYHGNGAESGFVSDTTSYANSATATILDYNDSHYPLTKDGYSFQGWATSAEGSVAKNAGDEVTISSADVHYYAVWASAYTITNGNPSHGTIAVTNGSSAITSAAAGATVHIEATPDGGYSFGSWSVTKDASGDPVSVSTSSTANPATFTMPAEAVTVDATFTPNDYTITYHLNGASWAGGYSAPANYTVGTGATLPVAGNMTNVGYTFNGWYANSDLSTGGVKTSISTSDFGDKEFWAKWTEITYDVTYNANGGSGTTDAQNGHYVTLRDNGFTAPSGKIFVKWNTASNGSGASYNEGEEVELTADLALYAIWADDYTITWDASAKLSGVAATPNLGGGNYTITASVATWTGTLTADMISAETAGVTITNVAVDNSASPKTITATFNVGASVAGTSITFELDVPAAGDYGAKSSTKDITIDRCTGSGSGSDGVLFSAEFKDSGLGTSNICDAANTPFTFTTTQLKSAAVGGSIKAYTTSNLTHMKYADNAISIAGTNGVIQIDLDNAISTNDLFTYYNSNGSSSSAYLRHTSASTTTDQIELAVYNKETKVRLPAGFNGKTTLYIVRKNNDFKLHKAAVVRPAFLMLLDDSKSATDLSGTDVELTTSTYLSTISGGHVYFTSPTSGNLKIYRSNSKNYIKFNNSAGYVKVVLNDALQEGDVIGFDSYNTNELAFTTTATRSTTIRSTGQLYTVNASSALKGQTTFYIWQYSGTSDYLRGLQIARSGIAGGGGGSDQITTSLTWSGGLADGGLVTKDEGAADFTYSASTTSNTLGAITYTSSDAHVTVSSTGKVHIGSGIDFGGADYKDFTITANLAESGCYESASITYTLRVNNTCEDVAGTIGTEDLGCSGIRMTVTGQTTSGETVSYQWYKDGASIGGATSDTYTATAAGEYYVIVTNTGDGHCSKASTNTVVLEAQAAATATKIVDEWYVKNGRRTPDVALVQTENATSFTVKSGSTVIWSTVTGSEVTTGFAGCGFYLGEDGIIYLKGQQDDESEPAGLSAGDETLKFTASACGGNSSELSITIHKQAETSYKTIAFVVEGTKGGDWNVVTGGQADGSALYEYLDSVGTAASARKFALTECNIYKTNEEKTLRQYYSQFDAILITDNPNTKTVPSKGDDYTKKGYVNAIGSLIDIRPVLTMEAFVSALDNWKAKGINGNPSSPDPRQYGMKLDCKNHAIFKGINSSSSNVEVENIDGVEYWTVIMVDSTKSPYSGVAYNVETKDKPALQGFEASDVSELMLLGEISDGALYAGVERQQEPAARLLLLGLNHQALPSALTDEGKKIIENALSYLIETDMERVDDCSNYFVGGTASKETDWNTASNWSKGIVPNSPYVKVRILSPCVVNSGTYKVSSIDIATSGKSINKVGTINGSLTINAGAALVVGGRVRSAAAPYFNTGDLMPTTVNDLVINTNASNQAALVFNNDKGDTKATVNLYSLGRKSEGAYQFQYLAVPMNYIDVNPAFAGSGIYTYVWKESLNNWERRAYYAGLAAFEGVGITTKFGEAKTYTLQGALTSTTEKAIQLTTETSGQNIVGNSWIAPIDIASLRTALVDDDNIVDKTVYIYCTGNDGLSVGSSDEETPGQWLAIPIEAAAWGAWGGLKVIPAMQAFCIKANSGTTMTLNYKDHVRSTASAQLNQPLRAPKREAEEEGIDLIRIRVADSKTHTDLYLFEGEQFGEEFDNGWEAKYMSSDGRSAKLYAETSVGQMAVAAQPEYEGTVLGFAPGKETEYTFTFSGPNTDYYLNDLRLKKSTLISEGESYLFTFEEGDTNRFYISKTRIDAPAVATGTENTADGAKARKVIVNDKLYIILNGKVYNAEGMMVR